MGHGTDDAPSQQPPSAEARRRLLRAVTELAGSGGRRDLTAERVAEHAGVPPETFFEFFADADGCLLAAHDDWVETGLRKLDRPLPQGQAGALVGADADRERVHTLLVWLLGEVYGCLAERPEIARLCLVEAPAVGRRGLIARERAVTGVRRVLELHATRGGIPDAGELTIQMVAGGIYDTAQRYAHAQQTDQLPGVAPAVAGLWSVVLTRR